MLLADLLPTELVIMVVKFFLRMESGCFARRAALARVIGEKYRTNLRPWAIHAVSPYHPFYLASLSIPDKTHLVDGNMKIAFLTLVIAHRSQVLDDGIILDQKTYEFDITQQEDNLLSDVTHNRNLFIVDAPFQEILVSYNTQFLFVGDRWTRVEDRGDDEDLVLRIPIDNVSAEELLSYH